jgi:uncharacterized protein (DUF849 family)
MPGSAASLLAGVAMLPAGATWSATGVGRTSVAVMLAALSLGGHLRVGMEDTLTYGPRRPARDNAELVERAARLSAEAFRPAATPDEARTILNLPVRR